MNALAMVIRCGERQCGERPGPWALRETQSSEPAYTVERQAYVPEEAAEGPMDPLPPEAGEAWA